MPLLETATAAALRARATGLRRLATQLTERDLRNLYDVRRRAGDDVWRGPLPDRCRDEVLVAQRRLDLAVDDLRRHALVLERQADEIDLRAAATAGLPA
ncbi:MAG: hypothetical protein NTZ21_05445 [Actinobacteria bacterium]|nr:hypothetical protein [Actinomycetota bacterium]